MRNKEITLPTLVGLLVAVTGLISGMWLVRGQIRQSAGAAGEEVPKDVRVTGITDSSLTVSWLTDAAVQGFIQYGEGQNLDLVVSDERDLQKGAIGSYFTHLVVVRGLEPSTNYSFKIGSGKSLYDQNGNSYQVKTGAQLPDPPAADVAYGQVITAGGEPAEGAIVYLEMPEAAVQAALVKTSGSWVIPLSTARSRDLGGFASYDKETGEVELIIQGGPLGSSLVNVSTQNVSPVPNVVLGQSYDFRQATGEDEEESKFSAQTLGPTTTETEELLLLTPRIDEKVNTTRPQIIGQAPPGTELTIEVQSEKAITGALTAGTDGRFSFTVPEDLTPGEHTITIKAVINGITRTISRTFVVYAAGESNEPFFTATPSGTLTPAPTSPVATSTPAPSPTTGPSPTLLPTGAGSVTVTVTPKPTNATTPAPTLKPTPTPVVTATDSALMESGYEMPLTLLVTIGMGLILTGAWWYRKAA